MPTTRKNTEYLERLFRKGLLRIAAFVGFWAMVAVRQPKLANRVLDWYDNHDWNYDDVP